MSVILYRYDGSLYSEKIDRILLLKKIPHETVTVTNILPRPEISELLGVTYRKIPVLAIGNDVYCDTSLIVSALERRFPAAQGFGTIFPHRKGGGRADTGLIKAFCKHYTDSVMSPLGAVVYPWESAAPEFLKDRSLLGAHINTDFLVAGLGRPKALSGLSTHLTLIEEQLSDGRTWLFDTETPSLADVGVHFVLAWLRPFPGAQSLFDAETFPNSLQWLARTTDYFAALKQNQPIPPNLSGADAAARIAAASFEPYTTVGFDEREAARLGLKAGSVVSVAPDDTGRDFPTVGTLVGLSREEFVLEVRGSAGLVRVHFPRVLFTATTVS
ncbi:hypothetical protein B0H16DRAFT_1896741 [Mycena metata]|uniref:GST N-terminal domain-containing protein n=1 Tax=Mycena metata TaxID=1033252 RepID=A0AAD7HHM6_9AGAR|nr:hypothetical protein B0H16DRAFT_1896741 [Mycena metata]